MGKTLAQNKKAFRELYVLERLEVGLVLQGTEVKSARAGGVSLADSYVQFVEGEAFLAKAHIAEYAQGSWTNHEPTRRRKILLHRRELEKLRAKVEERGLTLVPLKMYLNDRGLIKLEIGLGRGKKLYDRRQDMKKRDAERAIQRELRDR